MVGEASGDAKRATAAARDGKRKILLVDDHPVVRQGLARLINDQTDLWVCGEADGAAAALTLVETEKPDLAVIDISMGGTDGIELIKELKTRAPGLPALVLSMHDESLYAERVVRAGARGYVTKQEAPEKVMTAIRQILAGHLYVSEAIAERLGKAGTRSRQTEGQSPLDRLSDRELQVFRLIAGGMTVRDIADGLRLSVKTIETHREHIKEKLKFKSSAELLRYAVEYGVDRA